MIFYNIRKLEKRLINREVSEKLAFTYLAGHLVLLAIILNLWKTEEPLWLLLVLVMTGLAAFGWGLKKSFEINQLGGGGAFFRRFISISFVAALQSILTLFILIFLILGLLLVANGMKFSFFLPDPVMKGAQLVVFTLMLGLYFNTLVNSFRRIIAAVPVQPQREQ